MAGTAVVTDTSQSAKSIISRVGVVSVSLTTDGSGDVSTTFPLYKRIEKIFIQRGDLVSGTADITITDNWSCMVTI